MHKSNCVNWMLTFCVHSMLIHFFAVFNTTDMDFTSKTDFSYQRTLHSNMFSIRIFQNGIFSMEIFPFNHATLFHVQMKCIECSDVGCAENKISKMPILCSTPNASESQLENPIQKYFNTLHRMWKSKTQQHSPQFSCHNWCNCHSME